jgi:hypothetical protein
MRKPRAESQIGGLRTEMKRPEAGSYWRFERTVTLAEGHERCNFRFKRGGETRKRWSPPGTRSPRSSSASLETRGGMDHRDVGGYGS